MSQSKDQDQTNGSPSNNRNKSIKVSFLQISTHTEATLKPFDDSSWGCLSSEDPSSQQDLAFGLMHWDFLPSPFAFQCFDLLGCRFLPLVQVWIQQNLIRQQCIWIRNCCLAHLKVIEVALQEKGTVNGHGQTLKHIIIRDKDIGSVGSVGWVYYKTLDWSTLAGIMALSDGW